jgi:hypothetical protein
MGYYTQYELEHDGDHKELENFIKDTSNREHFDFDDPYAIKQLIVDWEYHGKWYGYKGDMITLSKQFPDVLFEISGAGETSGDLWIHYFKGGKDQREDAKISYGRCKL